MTFCVTKSPSTYNGISITVLILKYKLPTKSHACVTNVINSDNLTHKSVDICYTNTKSGDNLFMCCRIVSETLREILQVVQASGSSIAMASIRSQVFNQNTEKDTS